MGELTGTWSIYSQKIGSNPVFTARATSVVIDANNVSTAGFGLATPERVEFEWAGPGYFKETRLGTYTHHYRAQIRESNGLRFITGHVSAKGVGYPDRCVFVGLPNPKGSVPTISTIQLPMIRIPLFHDDTSQSQHRSGTINISSLAVGGSVLLNGTNPTPFKIEDYDPAVEGGLHLVSKKKTGTKTDTLEAWIIFGPGSRPIFIGYHNWDDPGPGMVGPPTSEYCTKAIVGW